jgi:lactate permease
VYKQVLDPVAHSLGWSSLVSLAVAIAIGIAVYRMPVGQALLAGTEGAAFGFFPILWIVINAIWVYQMSAGVPQPARKTR